MPEIHQIPFGGRAPPGPPQVAEVLPKPTSRNKGGLLLRGGHRTGFSDFYARQLYRQVLMRARISYGNSVCPSVLVSRPGTDSSPDQIETPGFHHMIA